jgi:hypothetical protein
MKPEAGLRPCAGTTAVTLLAIAAFCCIVAAGPGAPALPVWHSAALHAGLETGPAHHSAPQGESK